MSPEEWRFRLKISLRASLELVKTGESIIVTDRGRVVARLVPFPGTELAPPPQLEALRDAGLLVPGSGTLPAGFWQLPRPEDPAGAALDALLADREGFRILPEM